VTARITPQYIVCLFGREKLFRYVLVCTDLYVGAYSHAATDVSIRLHKFMGAY
jgi:hypothetical protein